MSPKCDNKGQRISFNASIERAEENGKIVLFQQNKTRYKAIKKCGKTFADYYIRAIGKMLKFQHWASTQPQHWAERVRYLDLYLKAASARLWIIIDGISVSGNNCFTTTLSAIDIFYLNGEITVVCPIHLLIREERVTSGRKFGHLSQFPSIFRPLFHGERSIIARNDILNVAPSRRVKRLLFSFAVIINGLVCIWTL